MRFLSAIVRVLTGQRFSDVTSGFRAFDRPVIELLAREHPVEYLADTVEALLIVRSAGFRVEVPISMRPRAAGVPSTRRFKLVINYLGLLIGILGSASRRARLRRTVGAVAPREPDAHPRRRAGVAAHASRRHPVRHERSPGHRLAVDPVWPVVGRRSARLCVGAGSVGAGAQVSDAAVAQRRRRLWRQSRTRCRSSCRSSGVTASTSRTGAATSRQ
jgi:hypothetical protein